MTGASELRLSCPARPGHVSLVRHALGAFLRALRFDNERLDDVTTAAGEALSNVVEHAYVQHRESVAGRMELLARIDSGGTLVVDVSDRGSFIFRDPLPERGFGLRIIRAIARRVSIETTDGTRVRMTFDGRSDAGS